MWTNNHKLYEEKNIISTIALLTIDFQKGFDEPVWDLRNNHVVEVKMTLFFLN
jgi:hypothetical protein